MKLQEAYEILGLDSSADDATIKKKYRELSKVWHPDVNKDPEATDKFKKINEANSILSGKSQPEPEYSQDYGGGSGLEDILRNMGVNFPFGGSRGNPFNNHRQTRQVEIDPNINVKIDISFIESIQGTKKQISYNVKEACKVCNGEGSIKQNNGCKSCGGKGVKTIRNGNVVMQSTCQDCIGKVKVTPCTAKCLYGTVDAPRSINVSVPAGVTSDSVLRVGNCGNYVNNSFMGSGYGDLFIKIEVAAHNDMHLSENGKDVISSIGISLFEALSGVKKTITTVYGDREINIPEVTKNKDQIVINGCGVNSRGGNHIVNILVDYPNDVSGIISVLGK